MLCERTLYSRAAHAAERSDDTRDQHHRACGGERVPEIAKHVKDDCESNDHEVKFARTGLVHVRRIDLAAEEAGDEWKDDEQANDPHRVYHRQVYAGLVCFPLECLSDVDEEYGHAAKRNAKDESIDRGEEHKVPAKGSAGIFAGWPKDLERSDQVDLSQALNPVTRPL